MANITQIVTSAIIKNKDGKFLIVKRAPHDSFPNMWEFPGGKSEFGEHPEDSVKREIIEETGLAITPICPVVVNAYKNNKKTTAYVEVFYIAQLSHPDQTVMLSEEHTEHVWIDFEEIHKYKTTEYIHAVINQTKFLLESGLV